MTKDSGGEASFASGEGREIFAVFDELPTPILFLDATGAVLRANRAASTGLERPVEELVGRAFFTDIFPSLAQDGVDSLYVEQIGRGPVEIDHDADIRLGGVQTRAHVVIRSFEFMGAPWGVALLQDMSALVREKERRKRAESLAAVGELAAGIAHEVNNPLASITSFAQLLSGESDRADHRRALQIIVDEASRISRIIDNLIRFAHQQGVGGREPVDLNEIAEEVLAIQGYALETAGVELRRDYDAAMSPVMGERGALQQAVLNLVVRAENALSRRPADRLLIIRTRESSEGVVLCVIDNGPGIPRERLPSLFEHVTGADDAEIGTTLASTATIVREHSGHIWAESETDRGTTAFYLRLPRINAPIEEVQAPAPVPPPQAPRTPHVLRVLVADDEPTLRLAISTFLRRRGHDVTVAEDAYEALRLVKVNEFDVALVDARMPGDGLRLLEQLEAMPALKGRTALMTGDLGRSRTQQGTATGRPYLSKPFDLEEMVRLVETLGN
ncbi:MAG TPA: response regulator [Longimicrobiaceae bacterium]|nr:response regulator [Longimicrobiaceae bacterium]